MKKFLRLFALLLLAALLPLSALADDFDCEADAYLISNRWEMKVGNWGNTSTMTFYGDGTGIQERPMRGAVENLHFYADGDTVKVGNLPLNVLHTPGHTPGSVVLTVEDVMFSGDTLFAGSCGRVDFPGGDAQAMLRSLKRLYQLEGDYTVLPGHMEGSTLQRERASNMYMKQAIR